LATTRHQVSPGRPVKTVRAVGCLKVITRRGGATTSAGYKACLIPRPPVPRRRTCGCAAELRAGALSDIATPRTTARKNQPPQAKRGDEDIPGTLAFRPKGRGISRADAYRQSPCMTSLPLSFPGRLRNLHPVSVKDCIEESGSPIVCPRGPLFLLCATQTTTLRLGRATRIFEASSPVECKAEYL